MKIVMIYARMTNFELVKTQAAQADSAKLANCSVIIYREGGLPIF